MRSNVLAVALFVALTFIPINAIAEEKSLYTRLGGYDAVSAVVNEFSDRLFVDARVKRHFGGMSNHSKVRFKQLNTTLVCAATGGPCNYLGRSMIQAHHGMKITDGDFGVVAGTLLQVLKDFKVPGRERTDLMNVVGSLKGQVVEPKLGRK